MIRTIIKFLNQRLNQQLKTQDKFVVFAKLANTPFFLHVDHVPEILMLERPNFFCTIKFVHMMCHEEIDLWCTVFKEFEFVSLFNLILENIRRWNTFDIGYVIIETILMLLTYFTII